MAEETKVKKADAKPNVKKTNVKKIVLIVVGALVALIILLFIFANAATSAPVKVSNDLVTYIQAQNSTLAYSLLSPGAKQTITPAEFEAVVDQIGPILIGTPDMQSKEVSADSVGADTAQVVYEIKGTDALTYVFTVNLVKVDGNWMVLNFDSTKKE